MFRYIDCADYGSEFCPCSLAERGECIICSQLKNQKFCDCLNWKGTCVYQEFIWNNEKSKKSREYRKFKIVEKRYLREDLILLKIKVNQGLARELCNIGAFVFLKPERDIEAYSTPISIMESDIINNIITVVFKIEGVKTKALKECDKEIMVKGPYWNGIQGRKYIEDLKNKSCLIIGRGVALAPAVLAAKKMINNKNDVYVVLDRGRSEEHFTENYFKSYGCTVKPTKICNMNKCLLDDTRELLQHLLKKWNYEVVLSAGSDDFHRLILNYIHNLDPYIKFATVNNSTMCCGEGVCGSCQIRGKNNEIIKTCKQQFNPLEVFGEELNSK